MNLLESGPRWGGWLALSLSVACNRQPAPDVTASSAPATPAAWDSASLLAGEARYSQHKEELIARDFFRDRRGGVFLDVGCASPVRDNNTCYLEKHLDWSGIAVDGLPEFAEPWLSKRPRSRFFNFLVSDHADTVEPFYRSQAKGTSGAVKQQEGMRGPGGKVVPHDELHIATTTLDKLLDAAGLKHVDYLSMDIEGYEPIALRGFDIERFAPELVCVEAKPANREKLAAYFAQHGYERLERYLAYDEVNYHYARKAR